MSRHCIMLIPALTELEYVIRPALEEWAEVAAFDRPGVGDEPLPAGMTTERSLSPEVVVDRAIAELDARAWESCVVVGDGWQNSAAVMLAAARPRAVRGLALGHASLSYEMDGERPAVSRAMWEAMGQLIRQDYRSFVRYGITQLTKGSFGDELAEQMLERMPMQFGAAYWEGLAEDDSRIGEMLAELDKPLLFAKHEGCVAFTDEGWQDAVAAFPDARTVVTAEAPSVSPAFADALREFCAALPE